MPGNTDPTADPQVVEVLGRNLLVGVLLTEGVEVALPVRDKGIDLVAYFCTDPPLRLGPHSDESRFEETVRSE